MKNRRIVTALGGTVVIGVVGTALMLQMLGSGASGLAVAAQDNNSAKTPPTRVEVMKPVRQPLTRMLRMPATLMPGEKADLFAKVSGYVSTLAVDIGSRVKKGDTLLVIDIPEMADELRQAQAVLAARRAKVDAFKAKVVQAESMIATAHAEVQRYAAEQELWRITVDRKRQLRDEHAISEQDFDEVNSESLVAQAKLRIAEANVESARAQKQSVNADVAVARSDVAVEEAKLARLRTLFRYATIRAPFDGVITDRLVDPGAFVRSAAEVVTTPLLTIANVSYIRLVLEIPESDVLFVQIGTEVEINVKALGSDPITASVTRTAVALKANTRTMRVEVDLDNTDGRFAPGMYAQVNIKLEFKQHALVIPAKALRVRGRQISVLVADGAVAKAIPIKIGYDDGILVEVLEGLRGDERIITSASNIVAPGTPVAPVLTGS